MSKNIKGITIEIDGNTSKLQKSLKDVNKQSANVTKELKDVERALKFNPGNTELIAQKQKLLSDQITNTSEKLGKLKEAQKQVDDQFSKGEISGEAHRAFQREVIQTENSLNSLKGKLESIEQEQKNLESSTKQLNTIFEATESNVDDYSDVLGGRLVNAIKMGTASSKQLDDAIAKIGKEALGTDVDLDKMKKSLDSVDDGNSINNIRKNLSNLSKEAESSGEAINDLGIGIENVIGGLGAGAGISKVVEQALDTSSLNTKIEISMEVPEESKQAVKEVISSISAYGVDTEEALEGVRRQWALNKDVSDEVNTAIVEGAATISSAYAGIDFIELIQETNEISRSLNITNDEALGLTNSLLKMGFPPEQLDIIAEYGTQLSEAGYNAQEIQAIFTAGVETGTWNIDNLLDGLKEGRIKLAEFGQEIPKATAELLSGTDISTKQLETWGKAVAKGGEDGKKAMQEVAQSLMKVEDETQRNLLGVQFFGTMWEDQTTNITDTLLNMDNHLVSTKENQDALNGSVQQLSSDPMIQMKQAIADLKLALEPVLEVVANITGKIAEWASNNPTLTATIVAIVSTMGILIGICLALAPVFVTLQGVAAALGVSIVAVIAPVLIVIGVIAALIAVGVALYKNWDEIKAKASELKDSIATKFEEIKSSILNKVTEIKEVV